MTSRAADGLSWPRSGLGCRGSLLAGHVTQPPAAAAAADDDDDDGGGGGCDCAQVCRRCQPRSVPVTKTASHSRCTPAGPDLQTLS